MQEFDVIVVGSGGGLKIALPAAQTGLKVAVIESGACGGTCLNRGCIPSKMLIYPADFLAEVRRCEAFNIQVSKPATVQFGELIKRIRKDTQTISEGIAAKLSSHPNIELIGEPACFVNRKQLRVGQQIITADRIFIACGARPSIPDVEGLKDVPYITSTEALKLETRPERMTILGAGYIACELGHAYGMFGTRTHFVVRSKMLRPEDAEIQRTFEDLFSAQHSIHYGTPSRVAYRDGEFTVEVVTRAGGRETITSDALLVATGVTPNSLSLDPQAGGVDVSPDGYIKVNEYLETSVPGVYALGDCVGNYLFRHSVNLEGEYLFRRVFENRGEGPVEYGAMPHAVFTDPEVACAGMTEEEAVEDGRAYIIGRSTYADSNMGMARRLDDGFVKLVIEKESRLILGVHIIGADAATLVQCVVNLMYKQGTLDDLLRTVYIHPALPEIVRDAARDAASQSSSD